MRKDKILKEAVVLLIAVLITLSSSAAMANTMKNDTEETKSTLDIAYIEYPTNFVFQEQTNVENNNRAITCYGSNLHNDPDDNLVWFASDTPGTLNHINFIASGAFLAGGCFVGDTWWACEYSDSADSNIWTIDENNGDMNLIGPAGVGLNGLAYDPSADILYGCGNTDLFTINQINGDSSPVGPFNTGGLMIGIACDNNGKMYGEDLGTDSLYEINTGTGEAVLIGQLGIDINYAQDIAYDKINDILYSTGYKGRDYGGGALGTLDLTDGHYIFIGDFEIGALDVPSEIACMAIPYGDVNEPPTAPEINGPPNGVAGTEYSWTFHSDDPNGDEIKYIINWGDGSSEETDCFEPCTPVEVYHTYAEQGEYTITAKAKECPDGLESDESTFVVTMPRVKPVVYHILIQQLLERFQNMFPIIINILGL